MPLDFWDTSALAKRYLPERGSAWAGRARRTDIVISRLTVVEIASVFRRRYEEGLLPAGMPEELYREFINDAMLFEIMELTPSLLARASALMLGRGLGKRIRTLDAIQLTAALEWFERTRALTMEPGAFIVADAALREAAVALGLRVEDPGDGA